MTSKTKINRIRTQQTGEFCGIQPINEWVEIRTEWDEYVPRMDAEELDKSQWTIYLLEEDLQDTRKEDGAT